MDWFPCNGNEGWYPREAGRQTHLLWVWQSVCPVYGLSQQPHEGINTNVMSPVVTVVYTVWLKSCDFCCLCHEVSDFHFNILTSLGRWIPQDGRLQVVTVWFRGTNFPVWHSACFLRYRIRRLIPKLWSNYLSNYTASHPIRLQSIYMRLLIKIVQDYIIQGASTSFYYCSTMTLYQPTNSYAVQWNTVHFRTQCS
jgi:hypothetical protein